MNSDKIFTGNVLYSTLTYLKGALMMNHHSSYFVVPNIFYLLPILYFNIKLDHCNIFFS